MSFINNDYWSAFAFVHVHQGFNQLTQAHEAIAQRVNVRFHLPAMSQNETMAYVQHHLKVVGVERAIFTEDALYLIHEYSGGIARKVNNVCTSCLLHAFAKSKSLVDDRMVRVVLENEFLG